MKKTFSSSIVLGRWEELIVPRGETLSYKGSGPAVILDGNQARVSGGGTIEMAPLPENYSDGEPIIMVRNGTRCEIRDIELRGSSYGTGIRGIKGEKDSTFFCLVDNVKISWCDIGVDLEDGANAWELRSVVMWRVKETYWKLDCTETLVSGGFCHLQQNVNAGGVTTVYLGPKAQHNQIIGLRSEPTGKSFAYTIEKGARHNQIIAQLNCSHRGRDDSDGSNLILRRGVLWDNYDTTRTRLE